MASRGAALGPLALSMAQRKEAGAQHQGSDDGHDGGSDGDSEDATPADGPMRLTPLPLPPGEFYSIVCMLQNVTTTSISFSQTANESLWCVEVQVSCLA